MTLIEEFLGRLEGTTLPYIQSAEDAQNPYCDSCSEPVKPNRRIQLYGVNKILGGREVPGGFRAIRLHCEDCRLQRLYLPCEGYAEYLIDATLDTEWTIREPDLVAVSAESSGIPYDPEAVLERLFDMEYEQVLAIGGFQSQGPLDVVDVLGVVGIDPREVIHDDGSVTVTEEHREKFHEEGIEIMRQVEEEGHPRPSTTDTLRAYLDTEPTDE